eukprot:CAMPEP_0172534974 /NCGR_PEP_ID=MMETSP1067-20121228/7162_1 /TAXON_ID=265564 ORGANISM="Thalassiosira punctigera, Strain Tpunct2005C2" /NCGR_SAMPLE_ID=MMETSP1067 /ASSEMBLY_ACC=CAM_ASM_000444 /LENGTH=177 /DNA_ID=CAMNT_0013319857 /DNA_START=92 /DNA_END=625 /DNA_ORIENTATION=-
MGTPDEEGLKGNKKGRPVWSFVKNASLAITIFLFFFTIVLVLDAYKFVSVRHAKFARKKLLRTLQYMDPSIIEAHTGMKVLTKDEFDQLQKDLEKARTDVREMNTKVQEKFSDVLKTSMELQNMKQDIDELKKLIAEKEAAQPKPPPPAPPAPPAEAAAPAPPADAAAAAVPAVPAA